MNGRIHQIKFFLPLFLVWVTPAWGFVISGSKWPGARAEFHVDMEGVSIAGISWNTAFISAADEWSDATDFDIAIANEHADPCLDDNRNGVDFSEDFCGMNFGNGVLAVTIRKTAFSVLGPARLDETDIVINAGQEFDVFDGPIIRFGMPGLDFRRVALHELGHAIGLDHETSAPAIMAPNIGNLDRLQLDDIAGVDTLYGGLANCDIMPLKLGNSLNALAEGDCRVSELTVGGGDDSFIDIYRFDLTATTDLAFAMTSDTLDSVLLVADANLNILDFDNQAGGQCDSSLDITLGAGSYFLLANTFDEPVKADCAISGQYRLSAQFSATELIALGANSSLLGDVSSAKFAGGISADNGLSFGNVFTANQSLDIVAIVTVDPAHQGQPGFLAAAALIDGEILLFDAQRNLIPFDPQQPLPRLQEKTLTANETIVIADDLVPASLGITAIEVDFVVGYGLLADPGEIFFHQAPLSLIVIPQ